MKFICHLRLIVAPAGGTCGSSIRLRIWEVEVEAILSGRSIDSQSSRMAGNPYTILSLPIRVLSVETRDPFLFPLLSLVFFFFFIHFHFYFPEQNPNPSPSAVVVINGRVLLIELPTNSVFMRLRRVHFAGLGIAVGWLSFPFHSIPFLLFCSVSQVVWDWMWVSVWVWVWVWGGSPSKEASKLRCFPLVGRKLFLIFRCAFSAARNPKPKSGAKIK